MQHRAKPSGIVLNVADVALAKGIPSGWNLPPLVIRAIGAH